MKLSPYSFSYYSPDIDRHGTPTQPCRLEFEVDPQTNPRTNVHVLIGRNGVGKSFILNHIATALTRTDASAGIVDFQQHEDKLLANRFANVVSVAYSAFDAFEPRRQSSARDAMRHHYIGLKKVASTGDSSSGVKNHIALAQEFGLSLKNVVETRRLERWQHYLEFLTSDPPLRGECRTDNECGRRGHSRRSAKNLRGVEFWAQDRPPHPDPTCRDGRRGNLGTH